MLDWTEVHHDVESGRMVLLFSTRIYFVGTAESDPQQWGRGGLNDWNELCEASSDESTSLEGVEGNHEPGTPVRWRLNRGLYDHKTWNRVTFWEEVLVVSLSEDMQRQLIEMVYGEHSDALNKFLELNPFTSSIRALPAYMNSFGISQTEVASLVRKICNQYSLSTDYTNLLLSSIEPQGVSSEENGASGDPPADAKPPVPGVSRRRGSEQGGAGEVLAQAGQIQASQTEVSQIQVSEGAAAPSGGIDSPSGGIDSPSGVKTDGVKTGGVKTGGVA
ncbi:hypothetical protein GNI_138420 [Gregarina niphandrodes]|uniref:Uncharacterized protein n=1 Tax=Gregarina niphandrodes TaxID=110365 RepID=A0A023B1A5_GRENI|nr:hypothetical protein GNI_138420 [Gregarina niphandrodes]EZG45474.1 hypothetical protein GNI_138420 [Gregarina niphandrodes]|eukprot:XP_011132492.1 hypothetical protein GNI_138420 [Gregarina niphandrodes]